MHSGPEIARHGHPLRKASSKAAQPHRDGARQIAVLAPLRGPLGQVHQNLPLRSRSGSNRHVLALKINVSGA